MKTKAFSLIELLVVIALIGILSAMVFAFNSSAKARGRDTRRVADVNLIAQKVQDYYFQNQSYPADLAVLSPFAPPADPQGIWTYKYKALDQQPFRAFYVYTRLETGANGNATVGGDTYYCIGYNSTGGRICGEGVAWTP